MKIKYKRNQTLNNYTKKDKQIKKYKTFNKGKKIIKNKNG